MIYDQILLVLVLIASVASAPPALRSSVSAGSLVAHPIVPPTSSISKTSVKSASGSSSYKSDLSPQDSFVSLAPSDAHSSSSSADAGATTSGDVVGRTRSSEELHPQTPSNSPRPASISRNSRSSFVQRTLKEQKGFLREFEVQGTRKEFLIESQNLNQESAKANGEVESFVGYAHPSDIKGIEDAPFIFKQFYDFSDPKPFKKEVRALKELDRLIAVDEKAQSLITTRLKGPTVAQVILDPQQTPESLAQLKKDYLVSLKELHSVLTHGDAHMENAIMTPDMGIQWIDFEKSSLATKTLSSRFAKFRDVSQASRSFDLYVKERLEKDKYDAFVKAYHSLKS